MRAVHRANEVDDHHQPRSDHLHAKSDGTAALGRHDPASCGDENQQERTPCLGKNAPPFVRRIQKIKVCLLLDHPHLLDRNLPIFVE